MNAERLQHIQEIFFKALEIPEENRDSYLATACSGDTELQEAVERYLGADAEGFSLIDTPIARVSDFAEPDALSHLPHDHAIGKYKVVRLLGKGGMGMVYLAYDHQLDRPVALKLLSPQLTSDVHAREQFLFEARAAAALDHPHVATIFEVGEVDDRQVFIAMSYYEGDTLAEIIERGPIPCDVAIDVAKQVALGLEAAHNRQVVHRDIKPANLIMTPEGRIKIIDFGIATVADNDFAGEGSFAGTVAYMSPEQANREAVDHRVDLWALGVVMYEMLAGQRPFKAHYQHASLYAIMHEDPSPLSTCPEQVPLDLERIVNRLLEKSPDDRYQSAKAVVEDLNLLGSGGKLRNERILEEDDLEAFPANMPAQINSFIGREQEIDQAIEMLQHARLLTLTGTGGTGKTRFSLQLASQLQSTYKHGICFVPLAPLAEAELVGPTIAKTLGVREMEGTSLEDRLLEFLGDKEGLLVLDNFEHVVEAGPLVPSLLKASQGLQILVTSRVPLHVQGEHEFPIPPLELIEYSSALSEQEMLQCPSVNLFVQRASAVKPAFQLNASNAQEVIYICNELDGLPLAIELAAARIRVLSPKAILTRLKKRLSLLTKGARDLPARHRTLREAIAWSYDLLTREEKKFFQWLSVFTGRFTLEAAEYICEAVSDGSYDILDGVVSLVEKNLLRQEEGVDEESCFFMLETIREFGGECLIASGEEAFVKKAHRDYYLELSEEIAPLLQGSEQAAWLDRLEQSYPNFRLALNYTIHQAVDIEQAARFGIALHRFWLIRGYWSEGEELLDQIISLVEKNPIDAVFSAKLWNGAATLGHNRGSYRKALALSEKAYEVYENLGDKSGMAQALNSMGWMNWRLCDYTTSLSYSEKSRDLYNAIGDTYGAAAAINNIGWVAQYQGDYVKARTAYTEVLEIQQRSNNQRGIAFAKNCMGWTLFTLGEHETAIDLLTDAMAMFISLSEKQLLAFTMMRLGNVLYDQGEVERATSLIEKDGLPLFSKIGDLWGVATSSRYLGEIRKDANDFNEARRLLHESLSIHTEIEDLYGTAAALRLLGGLDREEGHVEQAHERICSSLSLSLTMGDLNGQICSIEELAYLLFDQEEYLQGQFLLNVSTQERIKRTIPVLKRHQSHIEQLKTTLQENVAEVELHTSQKVDNEDSFQDMVEKIIKGHDVI